jgi:cytochrome c
MVLRHPLAAIAAAILAASTAAAQDVAKGKASFEACAVCHTLGPASTEHGPTLIGVWGRKAGARDDFRYSRALLRTNIVWDEAALDAYITDPQAFVPGTRMPFSGVPDNPERADLIGYLKTLR